MFRTEPIIWVQRWVGPGHAAWFRSLSELGSSWGVLLAVGAALWLWGRRDAYAVLGIVVAEAALTLLLNQLIHIPRPDAAEIVKYESVALGSFPSGHVFVTTVLWGLLYARRRVAAWLFAILVLSVAVARLYLGVHYLTDVVGGLVLGLLVVWAFHSACPRVEPLLARRSYPLYLGLGLAVIAGVFAAMALGVNGTSPFRWRATGLLAGGIAALLLEFRYVRYDARRGGWGGTALRLSVGALPLVPLVWYDRATGEDALRLGALLVGLGAVWALLAAPALLVGLHQSREHRPERRARAMRRTRTALLALLAAAGATVAFGVGVEPRLVLDVREEPAKLPGLFPAWEGRRLAVAADFQVRMWCHDTGMMRRVAGRIVEVCPAALAPVAPGDRLYLDRGTGTSLIPARIHYPPVPAFLVPRLS